MSKKKEEKDGRKVMGFSFYPDEHKFVEFILGKLQVDFMHNGHHDYSKRAITFKLFEDEALRRGYIEKPFYEDKSISDLKFYRTPKQRKIIEEKMEEYEKTKESSIAVEFWEIAEKIKPNFKGKWNDVIHILKTEILENE